VAPASVVSPPRLSSYRLHVSYQLTSNHHTNTTLQGAARVLLACQRRLLLLHGCITTDSVPVRQRYIPHIHSSTIAPRTNAPIPTAHFHRLLISTQRTYYTLSSPLAPTTPSTFTYDHSTWPQPSPTRLRSRTTPTHMLPTSTTHTASRRTRSTRPQTLASTHLPTFRPRPRTPHICPSPATRASISPEPPSAYPQRCARLKSPAAGRRQRSTLASAPPTRHGQLEHMGGSPTMATRLPSRRLAMKTCRASTTSNHCRL
jgi:hypothetical protein